jgi:hypothetical protein
VYVHTIAQVDAAVTGIHVIVSGPHPWLFSPTGWRIQRRRFHGSVQVDCENLTSTTLTSLRASYEMAHRFGTLSLRQGPRPIAIDASYAPVPPATPGPCEVYTLELTTPQPRVHVTAQATTSFAVALRDGKAVAGGQELTGSATHGLIADGIDTVVVYTQGLTALGHCIAVPATDDWGSTPFLTTLQLPIRELMPALTTPAAELAEARSRLLPGETLAADEFHPLADLLRLLVTHVGSGRPIDLALLLRTTADERMDEMAALDPLRAVLPHPKWRRALGFAYVDRDPTLLLGARYEYRVSGELPGHDLPGTVFGFHTTPARTPLPADFHLAGLRVRLAQPGHVTLADQTPAGALDLVTRRGVSLSGTRTPGWIGPGLGGASAILDFPTPVRSIVLDLVGPHSLSYSGGSPWLPPGAPTPVGAGSRPRLDFAAPVHQVRLHGEGFLCGVRVRSDPPATDKLIPVVRVTPSVLLAATAPPPPPVLATLANLQQPSTVVATDVPAGSPPPPAALGFRVRWLPAVADGVTVWPPDLPAPPRLDAPLFQIEHQQTSPPTDWQPLLEDDNISTGHRDDSQPPFVIGPGVDLMALYPELGRPRRGNALLSYLDVFDFSTGGGTVRRPLPPPGTLHRYRVRAVDAIGRASTTWTTTGALRLEKWTPPPLPAGRDTAPADHLARPAPTGVFARVLVRGARDLTADEAAILGEHGSAIILHWGWHDQQRQQDPWATEFRLYMTRRPLDVIRAVVTSVTDTGSGHFTVAMTLETPITAGRAVGQRLDAGYPFEIVAHGAGTQITADLRTRVPLVGGTFAVPRTGPVAVPVRLSPQATRPPAWGQRLAIQAIDDGTQYQSAPLYDLLDLSPTHPRDLLFVGVSAADAQTYVPDQLAPIDNRPGNESAIVAVPCEGRYRVRPVVVESPSLVSVPVVVAREPSGPGLDVELDLAAFVDGTGLASGQAVRWERTSDDRVFRAYRVDGNRLLGRVLEPRADGDTEVEVAVPNTGDRAAILAALTSHDLGALEDRYVVYLAASHPYRARLFAAGPDAAGTLPIVRDTLPAGNARWVYRVRTRDAAGNVSADGMTLRGVVRVPLTVIAAPARTAARSGDPAGRLRFRIDDSDEITSFLVFQQALTADTDPDERGALVRVPSTPALVPHGARLRLRDGSHITPEALAADGDAIERSGGYRHLPIDITASPGEVVRVWACALTRDGVTSPLAGPYRVALPPGPLVTPTLTATTSPTTVALAWSWPAAAPSCDVLVERSADGEQFERISPRLGAAIASFTHAPPPGRWFFRLRAMAPDGRQATSNAVYPEAS